MDYIRNDYETILARKDAKEEGSYTCYLFEQGIDKILKKVGEESTEMVIAAKNGVKEETVGEICDLLYHTLVMMVDQGISIEDVEAVLQKRAEIGAAHDGADVVCDGGDAVERRLQVRLELRLCFGGDRAAFVYLIARLVDRFGKRGGGVHEGFGVGAQLCCVGTVRKEARH